MPDIEIITDGQSDVIIDVETQQQSASVEVESQDEIINEIGTVALYGPKGDKGDKGDNAEIVGVTATVDSNVGTPDVTVTMGGTSTRRTFNFNFENLKGEQGIQGETGQTGATGNGITDITYASSSGLVDTYNVNYTNGNSDTISVTNGANGTDGVGISSISKTGTSGLVDTYTIDYTDGNDTTFTVTNGKDGIDGIDGYSPTATVTKSGDTATISITDKNGTTTETITDGTDGAAATITVGTVTSGSTASVTNSGTSSAAVFDFVLPKGDTGDTGQTGATGNGISSITKTGTSGLVDTYTIDYTNGNDTTFDVTNGKDGTNGTNGVDGYSPTATVSKSGTVATITITDKNGTTTADVYDGSGSITDVQINGTSITSSGVANIVTNTAYNASSNKIATMSDLPTVPDDLNDLTDVSISSATSGDVLSYNGTNWVNNGKYLKNTATGSSSLTIFGSNHSAGYGTNVGYYTSGGEWSNSFGYSAQSIGRWANSFGGNCKARADWSVVFGHNNEADSNAYASTAIGSNANTSASRAIQIGDGTNSTASSLQIGFGTDANYQLLDGTTGFIPNARLNLDTLPASGSGNAITSGAVHTALSNVGTVKSVNNVSPVNGNVSLTIPQGTVTSVNNTSPDANGNVTIATSSASYDSTNERITWS